ncbi:MAG: hypothetical protein ACP5VS_14580, partial [Desulfomonilaceae bacterium]
MAIFDIESLAATDGSCPTNSYDAERSINLIVWRPGDEAVLSFRIPYGINTGPNITVSFNEFSPGPGNLYSWDTRVVAVRPDSNLTNLPAPRPDVTHQFVGSEPAGAIITRSIFGVAANGRIDDMELTAGDIINLRIKFSCPDQNTCPHSLRTFGYRVEIAVDTGAYNPGCAGRVASIIRDARDMFNEETGNFLTDEFILRTINTCMKDLALEDYWVTEKNIAISAGQESINLFAVMPDLRKILRAKISQRPWALSEIKSLAAYVELVSPGLRLDTPERYFIQNNLMRLWPVPDTDTGVCVYYSRLPPPLGCAEDNCDPPLPEANDTLFTMFTLRQAFLRDRNAAGADLKFREYSQLYEIEKKRLLDAREPARISLR